MIHTMLAGAHRWGLTAVFIGACLGSTAVWAQVPGEQQRSPAQPQQQQTQQQQRLLQQQRQAQQRQAGGHTHAGQHAGDQTVRTGDGMLAIRATFPAEVRTGETFTYQVTVENATDNVTLHDVELSHTEASNLTIESIDQDQQEMQQRQRDQQQGRQQQQTQQQSRQQGSAAQQQQDRQQRQQDRQRQQDDQQQTQRDRQQFDGAQREQGRQQQADQQRLQQEDRQQQDRQQARRQQDRQQQDRQQQDGAQARESEDRPQTAQRDQQQRGQQQLGQQQREQQQRGQQGQPRQQQGGQTLSIDQLGPGESRTFFVSATADQEGPINACLVIDSYRPAICLQTRAVKPELNIVKTAPDQSRLCDIIELTYTVTNDGTGSVGRFEIVDQLDEGLRTIDDEQQLAFTVDQLEAGETRQFVASVYATRTGQFSSRAEARAVDSELTSRSENVGPEVVGADLQVSLESPGAVPSNTPAMFTAMVTNNGNAVAEDVEISIRIPEQAHLRRMSDVQLVRHDQQRRQQQQRGQQDAQQQQRDQQADQQRRRQAEQQRQQAGQQRQHAGQRGPQAQQDDDQVIQQFDAQREEQPGQQRTQRLGQQQAGQQRGQQQAGQQRGQQQAGQQQRAQQQQRGEQAGQQQRTEQQRGQQASGEMREERFAVGMLEPGQTARFDYVITARGLEEIYSEVEALYVCDLDVDDAASVVAQATTATRVIRLPGLQVYVVDDVDPVHTDEQVTYTIRVLNEGDALDRNVRVTVTLPNELEFEDAEGPSDFQEQQQQITFEPIEELAPGEELEYRLTAFVAEPGAVRVKVDLQSDSLAEAVRTEEPTRLFEADARN